jgi:hypothetical protein
VPAFGAGLSRNHGAKSGLRVGCSWQRWKETSDPAAVAPGGSSHRIRTVCNLEANDGILFDGESVERTRIIEEDGGEGVRVKLYALLAGARIPMQVDIGYGDAVYPESEFASFHSIVS